MKNEALLHGVKEKRNIKYTEKGNASFMTTVYQGVKDQERKRLISLT
jgi:hypothetical protein